MRLRLSLLCADDKYKKKKSAVPCGGSSVGDGDEKSPKRIHSLYVPVVLTFTPLFVVTVVVVKELLLPCLFLCRLHYVVISHCVLVPVDLVHLYSR